VKPAILKQVAATVEVEHARGGAIGQRLARNQFIRKVEIEVGNEHMAIVTQQGRAPPSADTANVRRMYLLLFPMQALRYDTCIGVPTGMSNSSA
jgi:hypothetical protein